MHTEFRHSSSGIGLVGALTMLFIALKLTGVITWSWLWVLSPIWFSAIAAMLVLLVVGVIVLVMMIRDKK